MHDLQSLAQVLEAAMLVCFGAAWPFSIWKQLRTKRTEGRSLRFLVMVLAGYIAGIVAKLARAAHAGITPEPVTALYVVNAALVGVDMTLFIRCRRFARPLSPDVRLRDHVAPREPTAEAPTP